MPRVPHFLLNASSLPLASPQAKGVPLPAGEVKIVKGGMMWSEFEWGLSGFTAGGNTYEVRCCFWLPVTAKDATTQ